MDEPTCAYIAGFLDEESLRWAGLVESCQALNYSKKRRHTVEEVARFLSNKGVSHPRND
jgi:hypothetical protein